MSFEINTSGEFEENIDGNIKIDERVSPEEIIALEEALVGEKETIIDLTQGRLADFLHTDILPNIHRFSEDAQTDLRSLANIHTVSEEVANETALPIEIVDYFQIDSENDPAFLGMLEQLGELGLNLGDFLSGIKDHIETRLTFLSPEDKEKIQQSVGLKTNTLAEILEDMDLGEMDREELRSQRWIINAKIKEQYDFYTNELFPTLELKHKLDSGETIPESYTARRERQRGPGYMHAIRLAFEELDEAMEAPLDDEGNFDEGFFSTQNLLNYNNRESMFQDMGIDGNGPDLLSEEDKRIEGRAMLAYLCAIGVQCLPYAGAVLSVPNDIRDIFSSQDTTLQTLQLSGLVDPSYRMEKTIFDNFASGVGVIFSLVGFQALAKSGDIAMAISKLSSLGIGLEEVSMMITEFTQKMNLSPDLGNALGKLLGLRDGSIDSPTETVDGILLSTGIASEEVLRLHGTLSDSERVIRTEEMLGISLSDIQKVKLLEAHYIEQGNNVEKGLILMRDGVFTREQARIIMDQGLAGQYGVFQRYGENLTHIDTQSLQVGDKLQVRTQSGSIYQFTILRIDDGVPYVRWSGGTESLQGSEGYIGGNSGNSMVEIGNSLYVGNNNTSRISAIRVINEDFEISSIMSRLRDTKTFDEVHQLIRSIPGGRIFNDNGREYSVDELIEIISDIRSGRLPIEYITRTHNLRNHIKNLVNIENSPVRQRRELLVSRLWPDGISNHVSQGRIGNCYFIAALRCIKNHPEAQKILTRMIELRDDGSVDVKFPGDSEQRVINITREQLNEMNIRGGMQGSLGDRILERAYARLIDKRERGEIDGDYSGKTIIGGVLPGSEGRMAFEGGYMFESFREIFGSYGIEFSRDQHEIISTLRWALEHGKENTILSLGSLQKDTRQGERADSYLYSGIDIFGRQVNIYHGHAYGIEEIDEASNSVLIVNPHNTSGERFWMRFDQVERYFGSIQGISLNTDSLMRGLESSETGGNEIFMARAS